MKRLFIFLVTAMMAVSGMAQGHLKFKGIEMDGTPFDFAHKLVQKGCIYEANLMGNIVLVGDFIGSSNCRIMIDNKYDLVYNLSVSFPSCTNWTSLYMHYVGVCSKLTAKYGEPVVVVENWADGITPKTDKERWQAVVSGKSFIYAMYNTPNGSISAGIIPDYEGSNACHVIMAYTDNLNNKIIQERQMEEL